MAQLRSTNNKNIEATEKIFDSKTFKPGGRRDSEIFSLLILEKS